MTEKKYNYFYKITNNLNGHYYYGVHCTNDLDDGYMGSGKRLHWAYEKYGIENFTKEILKFFENKDYTTLLPQSDKVESESDKVSDIVTEQVEVQDENTTDTTELDIPNEVGE